MKRTMVCLLLAMLMLLCACVNESAEGDYLPTENSNVTAAATPPDVSAIPDPNEDTESTVQQTAAPTVSAQESVPVYQIDNLDPFFEDRAWITYYEGDTKYYGITDLEGNVLARIKYHDNMTYTPFSNGFTHTYNYETRIRMIIGKDGNVTHQDDESSRGLDSPRVIFGGAGILVTVEDVSDFYGVGYQYTIINNEGNAVEQFTTEQEISNITDCGKGVIRFHGKGYLCLQTHTWVSDDITKESSCDTPNFTDSSSNACVIGVEDGDVPQLVLLYTDGTTTKIPVNLSYLDYLRFADFHPLNGDYLFITINPEYSTRLVASVNIATGEIYRLDASYSKILERIHLISDDRIVLLLRGADDDLYNFVFDNHMNLVCGPVDYFGFESFSESIIIGGNGSKTAYTAYDKDGNIIFSLGESGYTPLKYETLGAIIWGEYRCGALPVRDRDANLVYLNQEGNLLFDTFNFAGANHIETDD